MDFTNYTFENKSHAEQLVFDGIIAAPQVNTSMQGIQSTPVVVGIGLVGNITSILILCMSKMKYKVVSILVTACLVSDSLFLIGLLFLWLPLHISHPVQWCQFLAMLTNSTSFLSTWFVVAVCIQQWTLLTGQHDADAGAGKCSKMNAKVITIALTTIAVIINVNMTITIDAKLHDLTVICVPITHMIPVLQIVYKIDLLVNTIVPMVISFTIGVHSCYLCMYPAGNIVLHTNGTALLSDNSGIEHHQRSSVISYRTTKSSVLTMMLVTQLLPLPSHVLRIIHTGLELLEIQYFIQDTEHIFQNVAQLALHTSFSIKGYALFVFWKEYRKMTVKLLRRMCFCVVKNVICKLRSEPETLSAMWEKTNGVKFVPVPSSAVLRDLSLL